MLAQLLSSTSSVYASRRRLRNLFAMIVIKAPTLELPNSSKRYVIILNFNLLQLFYLSIIFSFSCLLSFRFQGAKIRRKIQSAKFFSQKPRKYRGKGRNKRYGKEKEMSAKMDWFYTNYQKNILSVRKLSVSLHCKKGRTRRLFLQ